MPYLIIFRGSFQEISGLSYLRCRSFLYKREAVGGYGT
jgi:hypothetical protein